MNYNKLRMVLMAGALLALALPTHAGQRCGVGTMIFGKNSSMCSNYSEESFDALSMDSFSITTGTSGCSNSGIAGLKQEELLYANSNFEELMLEMSEGKGEVLKGFAAVLGCRGGAVPGFEQMTRARYGEIYRAVDTSPAQMLHNVKTQISADPELARGCAALVI